MTATLLTVFGKTVIWCGMLPRWGPGVSDDMVLAMANQENALLLTADKDFGEPIFRQRLHLHGNILIRLSGLSPSRKAQIVTSVLRQHVTELSHAFAVIAPGVFRIRRFIE